MEAGSRGKGSRELKTTTSASLGLHGQTAIEKNQRGTGCSPLDHTSVKRGLAKSSVGYGTPPEGGNRLLMGVFVVGGVFVFWVGWGGGLSGGQQKNGKA